MERIPLTYGNGDLGKLICHFLGPKSYYFENVRDFLACRDGLKPIFRLPRFIGYQFNGLAIVSFKNNLRFNLDDGTACLADTTGDFFVDLGEVKSRSSYKFGIKPEQRKELEERRGSVLSDVSVLCKSPEKAPVLVNFNFWLPENQDRFTPNGGFNLKGPWGFT